MSGGKVRGALEKFDADEDDSSHVPLMFPAHRNISLRKSRPVETHVQVSDLDDPASPFSEPEAVFTLQGSKVLARLTSTGLSLVPYKTRRCQLCQQSPRHIPYREILSATLLEKLPLMTRMVRWARKRKGGLALALHGVSQCQKKAAEWRYKRLILLSEDPALARGWVAEVNGIISSMSGTRPSRVLALVNPEGGAKKAAKVWTKKAQPILQLAGVECITIFTQHADHALEIIADMSLEDLQSYDGFLAVGGDGLFQELVNGVLTLRKAGGPRADAAEGIRLAQIPAGSTDAVAWTLNGTRSAEAAALHVALGDGSSLDVMRVDSGDGRTRHSVCYAAYGYMGDLMRRSERLRWLGPLRYALAGAVTFLLAKSYSLRICYLPAPSAGSAGHGDVECVTGCEICASGAVIATSQADFVRPADQAFKGSVPKELQGEYRSVMATVTPCRSDLSPVGLSPHSHLADGRIRLILVKKCSQLDYLRFLTSIPKSGVIPGRFDFVEMVDVSALSISPMGQQSSWNVDGELLKHNHLDASIHRGLVQTFSRGIPA